MGVFFGIERLTKLNMPPAAVSGVFTMSPLLVEEVKANTSIPALTIAELMSGEFVNLFIRPRARIRPVEYRQVRISNGK